MFILIPTDVETLEREKPWMNWVVIGITVVLFFATLAADEADWVVSMVLVDWNPMGVFGHLLLHGDFLHLAGNMIFLWTFGNVVCRTAGNKWYLWLYLLGGLGAAATHLLVDGSPAVGASGAVNGMVGIALAMFPFNKVDVRWVVFYHSGTFQIKLWALASIWFVFDLWGALSQSGGVAYAAHIGGLLTGLGIGMALLGSGQILLSVFDQISLWELLTGTELERLDDEIDNGGITEESVSF